MFTQEPNILNLRKHRIICFRPGSVFSRNVKQQRRNRLEPAVWNRTKLQITIQTQSRSSTCQLYPNLDARNKYILGHILDIYLVIYQTCTTHILDSDTRHVLHIYQTQILDMFYTYTRLRYQTYTTHILDSDTRHVLHIYQTQILNKNQTHLLHIYWTQILDIYWTWILDIYWTQILNIYWNQILDMYKTQILERSLGL